MFTEKHSWASTSIEKQRWRSSALLARFGPTPGLTLSEIRTLAGEIARYARSVWRLIALRAFGGE